MILDAPEVTPHGLLALLVVGIVVLPCITAARQWILRNRTRSWASTISDGSLIAAATLMVASCSMVVWTTVDEIRKRKQYHSDEFLVELTVMNEKFLKIFFVNGLLYTVDLWLLKASFLGYFFGLKSHLPKSMVVLFYAATAYTIIGFVVVIIIQLAWCRPFSNNWAVLNNCNVLVTVFGITLQSWLNITADLLILTIALIAIYSIHLGHAERYALCFIALIGCVPICLTTARFVLSYKAAKASAMQQDGLAFVRTATAWGFVELFFTIVVFCLPAFRVFLRSKKQYSRAPMRRDGAGSGYTSGTFATFRSSYQTAGRNNDGIKVEERVDVDFERVSAVSQIRLNAWTPEWEEANAHPPAAARTTPTPPPTHATW